MKLITLHIENFKGLKTFDLDLNGKNAEIVGANGEGKTTIYDAFKWLLFDKDSTDRKAFEIRPLDEDNQPIKGLVVKVEAMIALDNDAEHGPYITFRKQHEENIVKKQLRGYTTLCWIDEVPKKVSEYAEFIESIMPEETFKMLTDVTYFNEKMHWSDRRKVLLDIAGNIGQPAGFDALLAAMKGRSLEDFKQVLAEQKKRITKERDEINPRIDELQKGLDSYATPDKPAKDLQILRTSLHNEIIALEKARHGILESEQERQKLIEQLNQRKADRLAREAQLKNNLDGVKKYIDEKAEIQRNLGQENIKVDQAAEAVAKIDRYLHNDRLERESCTRQLAKVQAEYKDAKAETPPAVDENCPTCKQHLPPNMMQEVEEKRQADEKARKARLAEIIKRGNDIKKDVDNCDLSIEKAEKELKQAQEQYEQLRSALHESSKVAKERMDKLDTLITGRKPTPPEKDAQWLAITEEINALEASIGEPAAKQLADLESERQKLNEQINGINTTLAQADRIKRDTARIIELQEQEKALSQQLADIDKQLADIAAYSNAHSLLIESAVNGRFKYVTFKLFNHLQNGSTEECCMALLVGVPHTDCSYGQKNRMGIDVINVLCEHYKKNAPLFVDNAESLTYPVEYTGQTILLKAIDKKKLSYKAS